MPALAGCASADCETDNTSSSTSTSDGGKSLTLGSSFSQVWEDQSGKIRVPPMTQYGGRPARRWWVYRGAGRRSQGPRRVGCQFAGDWKECGTPMTLSKFLNSVICQDRQKGTPRSPILMENSSVKRRLNTSQESNGNSSQALCSPSASGA